MTNSTNIIEYCIDEFADRSIFYEKLNKDLALDMKCTMLKTFSNMNDFEKMQRQIILVMLNKGIEEGIYCSEFLLKLMRLRLLLDRYTIQDVLICYPHVENLKNHVSFTI